jgi:hypothetical protein
MRTSSSLCLRLEGFGDVRERTRRGRLGRHAAQRVVLVRTRVLLSDGRAALEGIQPLVSGRPACCGCCVLPRTASRTALVAPTWVRSGVQRLSLRPPLCRGGLASSPSGLPLATLRGSHADSVHWQGSVTMLHQHAPHPAEERPEVTYE